MRFYMSGDIDDPAITRERFCRAVRRRGQGPKRPRMRRRSAEHKYIGSAMRERNLVLVSIARSSDRSICHADIKQTQRYLNITDEELRKTMTGVWERRRQLRAVGQ